MRLIKWIVLIWCCLILIAGLIIAIGRGQPPSDGLALLHFDECELPCWIGITPGKTPWDKAKQIVTDKYSGEQYSVQFTDDSNVDISINGTTDVLSIEIAPLSFSSVESPVSRIGLVLRFTDFGSHTVSIGELVAAIGSPSDIIMSDLGAALLFKESRVHIQPLQGITCNMMLTRFSTLFIAIDYRFDEYLYFSAPTSWRGFNRCYKLR